MENIAIGTLVFISLLVLARRFVLARRSALALKTRRGLAEEQTLSCRGFCDTCDATDSAIGGSNKGRLQANEQR